jgi:hypothetical protein
MRLRGDGERPEKRRPATVGGPYMSERTQEGGVNPPPHWQQDQLFMSVLVSSLASMGSRKGLLASGAPAMASFSSLEAAA